MITIFIFIYFYINIFISGYLYGKDTEWWSIAIAIPLGLPIFICLLIYGVLCYIGEWIDSFLQLRFWCRYHFGDGFYKLDKDRLTEMNELTIKFRSSDSLRNKIYRYCMRLINKRNNYFHSVKITEE